MALTLKQGLDYDTDAVSGLISVINQRGAGYASVGDSLQSSESGLSWAGPGRDAADSAFQVNRAYAGQAAEGATKLGAALARVNTGRAALKEQIAKIIQDGAQLRFTISDSGEISDFYGSSGLAGELPADQQALYLKLKSELPGRVADAIATGNALDDETVSALTEAAGLQAPSALTSPQSAVEDLGNGVTVTTDQGVTIVTTGPGDDVVSVSQDSTGKLAITVNGTKKQLTAAQSTDVLIQTQGGNDRISIPASVTARVRIQAGDGNDTIDDQAIGGSYIDAGAGDDTVTLGGGHNTVYLGSGTNKVTGSKGADYINGGNGNNTINAGSGASVLYGGTGTNTINAGTGKDTIYTGSGHTTVNNQGGQDTVYAQAASHVNAGPGSNNVITIQPLEVPDNISVNGSPEFQRRIQDDFEMLASSPDGQTMLNGLGHSGHTLLIDDGHLLNDGKVLYNNGYTAPADGQVPWTTEKGTEFVDPKTGKHGAGNDAIISIDTTLTELPNAQGVSTPYPGSTPDYHELNPTVVMFHEMAHAYDNMNGTMMPGDYGPNGTDKVDSQNVGYPWSPQYLANAEHEAVGLPVDWDGNKNTAETPVPTSIHPHGATENALRDEMGLPDRQHYLG